ncbi:hypothetical protein ACJMK2_034432 [Sinanodonta woodiana]|uniref:Group XIIA secretory phospholipase A2 n=1 Tax=Sinanodonta woodiana TaxID=1069815 RepID=A0ABD3WVP6_SINWO
MKRAALSFIILFSVISMGIAKVTSKSSKKQKPKDEYKYKINLTDDQLQKLLAELRKDEALKKGMPQHDANEECVYRCKDGGKPKPRPGHTPSSNGCGSFGLELDTSTLPAMTKCCDAHDECYDTCNKDKLECDKKFKKCLEKMCTKLEPDLNDDESRGCRATAMLMSSGTQALGCQAYLDSQKTACECKSSSGQDKSKSRKKTEL